MQEATKTAGRIILDATLQFMADKAQVTTRQIAIEIMDNPAGNTAMRFLDLVKVGVEQAKALQAADIKVISNAGNVESGIKNIGDLLSSKGGTQLGAMLEAVAQTEAGKAVVSSLVSKK